MIMSLKKNRIVNTVRAIILLPICVGLFSLIAAYVLYGHQSLKSTRRLYGSDHALLLSESRALLANYRHISGSVGEEQRFDIDSGSLEYEKLPATIRYISPLHVRVENDQLVLTLGVWPSRYAIITSDASEVLEAQQIDEGIWIMYY